MRLCGFLPRTVWSGASCFNTKLCAMHRTRLPVPNCKICDYQMAKIINKGAQNIPIANSASYILYYAVFLNVVCLSCHRAGIHCE